MKARFPTLAVVAGLIVWGACDQDTPTSPTRTLDGATIAADVLPGTNPNPGQVDPEEFELCKVGSEATFDYEVAEVGGPTVTGQVTLQDGDCVVIAAFGGAGADVTVTETSAETGYVFDNVVLTTYFGGVVTVNSPSTNPSVSYLVSGTGSPSGNLRGALAVYTNVTEPEEPPAEGRMTGGGNPKIDGVNLGLTLHCDITLSNNLEVNWDGGNWHLDKPIESALCTDDPDIIQAPPAAPLDTFMGTAFGRLDGVDGSYAEFSFTDGGEPGWRNDTLWIKIWAPGADPLFDSPVLDIAGMLTRGNLQAHYDQPHGSNVNNP